MNNKILSFIIFLLLIFLIVLGVLIYPKTKQIEKVEEISKITNNIEEKDNKDYPKAPVIFVDHGSPARILEDNDINRKLSALGEKIKDNVKGVIFVSAHNLSRGYTYVSNIEDIKILYDFSGFPDELYNIKYNVKGDLELSRRLNQDLDGTMLTQNIRNDHGIWTILKMLFPEADKKISVLTINMDLDSKDYYDIGNKLKKYREEGYLIITSGSILHNFDMFDRSTDVAQEWAQEFNDDFLSRLENKNFENIINYQNLKNVNTAFKTKDHYVPVVYAVGAIDDDEKVEVLSKNITIGSLSNNLVVFGEY